MKSDLPFFQLLANSSAHKYSTYFSPKLPIIGALNLLAITTNEL